MNAILQSRLAPFRSKSFRQFFFTQTLSLTGSFASELARAWIVISEKGSAAALGGLLLANALPGLFLMLQGGVLVDQVDVRKLMMWTKTCLAIIALSLAALSEVAHIQYWHLILFALIEGLVTAFDQPAFHALTSKLVPKEDFQQALALSSTNFHTSRMMGPLISGVLMAWHGPSLVFLFDGLTFAALVYMLWQMKLPRSGSGKKGLAQSLKAMWEGFQYIAKEKPIRYKVLQLMLTISLIYPLMLVVFRTYVQHRFQLEAEQFGYIFTLPAIGSMTGALIFAVIKPKQPIRSLMLGIPGVTVMMFLVTAMPSALLAATCMGFAGFFMYLSFASLTVSAQIEMDDRFRGRVSSVIGLCFVSIGPLMGYPVGLYTDWLGFDPAILTLTVTFLVLSGILAYLHRHAHSMPSSALPGQINSAKT